MPIVVNTNVSSLNAQRSLNNINRSMDKALERLASGLRINRSGDDAAGLAIADGLQAQTRGLSQAVRNAGDGLSVVGVAEGTLTTQVGILQRIRELAVQAANDINSSTNRQAIQDEIEAQISELTRLGNTTEFNGQLLLNGSFSGKKLQVGAFASQTIDVTIGDFRASGMGQIATVTGAVVTNVAFAGNLTLNGGAVGASVADGVSSTGATVSALAKTNAINEAYGLTGVRATANAATYTSATAMTAGNITAAMSLTINGVAIIQNEALAVQVDDTDGLRVSRINAKSNDTGVVASITGAGAASRIVLTAADGRNINVTLGAGSTAGLFGFAAGTVTSYGTITLTGDKDINIGGGADVAAGGFTAGVTAVDPNKAVNKIDVTTQAGANTGIQIIDSALKKVAQAQGQLGALTNRLENTITNLQTTIENLSASESRIRDADFAAETANLTRAQIIQQAGVAVLSQANLKPQAALALIGQ